MKEIRRLTTTQLRDIYFCLRGDRGYPELESFLAESDEVVVKKQDYKTTFFSIWRKRGYSEKEVQNKWQQYCEQMKNAK